MSELSRVESILKAKASVNMTQDLLLGIGGRKRKRTKQVGKQVAQGENKIGRKAAKAKPKHCNTFFMKSLKTLFFELVSGQ